MSHHIFHCKQWIEKFLQCGLLFLDCHSDFWHYHYRLWFLYRTEQLIIFVKWYKLINERQKVLWHRNLKSKWKQTYKKGQHWRLWNQVSCYHVPVTKIMLIVYNITHREREPLLGSVCYQIQCQHSYLFHWMCSKQQNAYTAYNPLLLFHCLALSSPKLSRTLTCFSCP